jgi:hypothetical protein
MSDYLAQKSLDHIVGKTSFTMPTTYVSLFTVAPSDAGTGGTEISGGGYARVTTSGATWNAASGSDPSVTTNAAAITFPTSTGSWNSGASIIAWGLYDASSAGNLLFWDYLGNNNWLPFTGTSASPSVLTVPAHGYSNGDLVVVASEFGGTLPATGGSWSGTKTVASVATDTFTAGVNTTGTGSGMVRKVVGQIVNATNITFSFGIGNLTLTLT